METTVDLDTYAILPGTTLFCEVVRTALIKLGYTAAEAMGAKGMHIEIDMDIHMIVNRMFLMILFHGALFTNSMITVGRGAKQGGGGWGGLNPPEFWMGGLNACEPPLILRNFFLGGVGSP